MLNNYKSLNLKVSMYKKLKRKLEVLTIKYALVKILLCEQRSLTIHTFENLENNKQ